MGFYVENSVCKRVRVNILKYLPLCVVVAARRPIHRDGDEDFTARKGLEIWESFLAMLQGLGVDSLRLRLMPRAEPVL